MPFSLLRAGIRSLRRADASTPTESPTGREARQSAQKRVRPAG
ncbi:hypothetical protein [Cryobacterium gelidum]|nr:hypothetical protein [Cryobacterium gelidum]